MIVSLTDIYQRCLNADYIHTKEDGDYALEREGDTLYILFQCTDSTADWISNFSFPAKPYKDMGIKWYCHRGFLRVWKAIKPHLETAVKDSAVEKIVVVGYSHGAAIATLCHEYVWFNRPDLRENGLEGFGFGCPRCFFGWRIKKGLKERWKHFHPVRNANDLVTHVPFSIMGFRHVSRVVKLPKTEPHERYTRLSCINAHYPMNYLKGCQEWDRDPKDI